MAIAVLGGLTLSTLPVCSVPAFYVVTDRIKHRVTGKSTSPVNPLPHSTTAA